MRAVRKGLLAQAGRGRRIRAKLLPPSLRRRGRPSLAERRYALTDRIRLPRGRRGNGPEAKPADTG
ncbi:hypothetical protein [Embleya sp. NBC_00896]|uniref:hypothetical protein n=1 Tax=Embleya sp. NBC_00896 TaxID=2975961 RepID=UPI003865EAE4|nr:hypothetical protein OG928_24390 [Embleya sp. NBC_00896]